MLNSLDICFLGSAEAELDFLTQLCLSTRSNATAESMKFVGVLASLCLMASGKGPVVVETVDPWNDIIFCCRIDETTVNRYVVPSKKAKVRCLLFYIQLSPLLPQFFQIILNQYGNKMHKKPPDIPINDKFTIFKYFNTWKSNVDTSVKTAQENQSGKTDREKKKKSRKRKERATSSDYKVSFEFAGIYH
jgi:hypothetical protein